MVEGIGARVIVSGLGRLRVSSPATPSLEFEHQPILYPRADQPARITSFAANYAWFDDQPKGQGKGMIPSGQSM